MSIQNKLTEEKISSENLIISSEIDNQIKNKNEILVGATQQIQEFQVEEQKDNQDKIKYREKQEENKQKTQIKQQKFIEIKTFSLDSSECDQDNTNSLQNNTSTPISVNSSQISQILQKSNKNLWIWNECPFVLKQTTEEQTKNILSLSPNLKLVQQENIFEGLQLDCDIKLKKNFLFNEEIGFNWHKSWNIPDIYIELQFKSEDYELELPDQLIASFHIVTVMDEDKNDFYLNSLFSQNYEMQGGKCKIDGNKFTTTTYNNDGKRFNLVIVIWKKQLKGQSQEGPKEILFSMISPSIYVDSRKQARASQKVKNFKKQCPFTSLFEPELFNKQFYKREKIQEEEEQLIQNDLEGLFNYLSAPNIRQKVKHPLFLYKLFSSSFSIYYNTSIVKNQKKNYQKSQQKLHFNQEQGNYSFILEQLQYTLENSMNIFARKQEKTKEINLCNFLIVVQSKEKENLAEENFLKKIEEYLEPLQKFDTIKVLINPVRELSSNFQKIPLQNIMQNYKLIYQKFQENEQCFQQFNEQNNETQQNSENCLKRKGACNLEQQIEQKIEKSLFHKKIIKIDNRQLYIQKTFQENFSNNPTAQDFLNTFPYLKNKQNQSCNKINQKFSEQSNVAQKEEAIPELSQNLPYFDPQQIQIGFNPENPDNQYNPILIQQYKKIINNHFILNTLQNFGQNQPNNNQKESTTNLNKNDKTGFKPYKFNLGNYSGLEKQNDVENMYKQQQFLCNTSSISTTSIQTNNNSLKYLNSFQNNLNLNYPSNNFQQTQQYMASNYQYHPQFYYGLNNSQTFFNI